MKRGEEPLVVEVEVDARVVWTYCLPLRGAGESASDTGAYAPPWAERADCAGATRSRLAACIVDKAWRAGSAKMRSVASAGRTPKTKAAATATARYAACTQTATTMHEGVLAWVTRREG